jgi:formylglycine-generating enzyme required for sulfatase activity
MSTTLDCTYANYGDPYDAGCGPPGPHAVGTDSPKGDAKWGQADMAGNLDEWVLDWYAPYGPCNNCAYLTPEPSGVGAASRVVRGGAFDSSGVEDAVDPNLSSSARGFSPPTPGSFDVGFRCARMP